MLQLMLVRGTEKMSGEQIAATADRLGGSIDAYGDYDYSEITATALSRNWQAMLEMVADVALRPTLPDGTVAAVRDFLVRQIRNRGEKPFDVASDQTNIALFGPRHPYAWDPTGRSEAVQKLNREALVAYYRRQYVPSQMVLAVSGDVKSAEVMPQAQRLFGAMPAGTGRVADRAGAAAHGRHPRGVQGAGGAGADLHGRARAGVHASGLSARSRS